MAGRNRSKLTGTIAQPQFDHIQCEAEEDVYKVGISCLIRRITKRGCRFAASIASTPAQ
jgi:hypothetical protein